jgi:hypothetical protein
MEPLRSITDDQIVTERKLPRRSFLSSTGALLGGAAAIVAGLRASTVKNSGYDDPKPPKDPDQQPADPDKRSGDPDKRSTNPDARREGDKKRDADKKPRDTDGKQTDPDKPPSGQR